MIVITLTVESPSQVPVVVQAKWWSNPRAALAKKVPNYDAEEVRRYVDSSTNDNASLCIAGIQKP